MKALFDSLVRTYVPWLAGVIIGWLVSLGIPLDPDVGVQVTLLLMGVASIVYYAVARIFALHVSPKLGWLIDLPKQPIYDVTSTKPRQLRSRTKSPSPCLPGRRGGFRHISGNFSTESRSRASLGSFNGFDVSYGCANREYLKAKNSSLAVQVHQHGEPERVPFEVSSTFNVSGTQPDISGVNVGINLETELYLHQRPPPYPPPPTRITVITLPVFVLTRAS